jgi:hypothetical protein
MTLRPARIAPIARGAIAIALLVPAALQVARLAGVLRARAAFDMDLEWMEGAHLYHAYRLTHGLPLYVDPARGFATFPYPPVYWAALGGAGALFGLDYATARIVSIACVAASAVLLASVVFRSAPSRATGALFGVIAVAGIAAGYPLAGGAYDLARPDALALLFPIVAAALIGDGSLGAARTALAALALSLAIYTKQTGVFFALALVGFVAWRDRRTAVRLAGATFAMCAVALAVLAFATDGWFFVWLFDQSRHGFRSADDWSAALGRFAIHAPFLLGLPWLVPRLAARKALRPATVKWAAMLGAAFVASMLPFMKVWGWSNVLMPFVVLSWPVGLLFASDWARASPPRAASAIAAGTLVAGAALSAMLLFDRAPFVPNAERRAAADRLRALVRELDGPVVVTTSPFVALREGKGTEQPILQGYADAQRGGLRVNYAAALDRSGAKWLIVSPTHDFDYRDELRARFEWVRTIEFPVQWMPDQPVSLWKRR